MAQTENQKKLLKILNEIFQLDQSDLDFGIYRIMNTKSQEINDFLDKELLSSVASAFSKSENEAEQKELEELKAKDTVSGYINGDENTKKAFENLEDVRRYILLNEKLSSTTSSSNLENEVFSRLANFFKRYYKDGDFVSLRRYKKDTYALPYEGEEVKLYWANSDQYYIKSGEYFRDYTFIVNGKTIHLKLSDAETQSDNNKATSGKERRFVILESNPCEVVDNELYINFEYKAIGKENQDKLNENAISKTLENTKDSEFKTALKTLAPTEKNKKRTIFEKHLKSYTSRNSFDYFIHKDLGGFLGRELDFYIKNEMLFLDDIMDSPIKYEEVMSKIKIFKEVSQKIITFLAQLEELQKRLWEKKKFIIETNYCITLDKIHENHYEKILTCKEQLKEWKTLFDVDAKTIDELKEERYLVLDTNFFDMEFKYKLLSEFDNLDEEIDGVLINSENFGALNLLQDRYKEQVKTVYIDPPYNTGNDGFLYNDNYQHSSWMSFMYDRLKYAKELMSSEGVIFSSIDDNELKNFQNLYSLTNFNFIATLPTIMNLKGNNDEYAFAGTHEYSLAVAKEKNENIFNHFLVSNDEIQEWKEDEYGFYKKGANLKSTGGNAPREKRPNLFYPIFVNSKNEIYVTDSNESTNDNDTKLLPITNEQEMSWRWKKSKVNAETFNIILVGEDDEYSIYKKQRPQLGDMPSKKPKSIFYKPEYSSGNGTAEQKAIFGDKIFANPKPLALISDFIQIGSNKNSTILDFFAGSGTTGHAVINLNREDNGKRKYLLVEMGEYFNSVTKPRIQKVIYSDGWKDGKPTTKNGISQIFKYFKLESYEDTLNNLEFKKTDKQNDTLGLYPQAKEDYILNYSLDVESQGSLLNIDTFSTPFDYKLKIATSSVGETKDTNIDLVETFNNLLGLVVKRIELLKGYLVVEGHNLKKEKILIIWRDGQSSDELNEFFKKMDWSVYDREFDTIYVNGDNNLDNLRKDEDHFKVKLIEQKFKDLMFKSN